MYTNSLFMPILNGIYLTTVLLPDSDCYRHIQYGYRYVYTSTTAKFSSAFLSGSSLYFLVTPRAASHIIEKQSDVLWSLFRHQWHVPLNFILLALSFFVISAIEETLERRFEFRAILGSPTSSSANYCSFYTILW